MFSTDDARTTLGIIGNITALILFLSPAPAFYRIVKKKSVEQYSAAPYLATFVNCGLWVLYGLPMVNPHSTLVLTINGTGFLIEIVYLLLFLIYSDRKKRVRLVLIAAAECLFIAVLALLVLTLVHSTKLRSTIVGSICIVGNIVMYASPLAVMKLVIATRSVEFMPFLLSLFSFLNGISWAAYATIRFDPFIAVPNGMGALLGLVQLILYATFYKSTQRMMAERKTKSEVSMADSNGPNRSSTPDYQNGHVSVSQV